MYIPSSGGLNTKWKTEHKQRCTNYFTWKKRLASHTLVLKRYTLIYAPFLSYSSLISRIIRPSRKAVRLKYSAGVFVTSYKPSVLKGSIRKSVYCVVSWTGLMYSTSQLDAARCGRSNKTWRFPKDRNGQEDVEELESFEDKDRRHSVWCCSVRSD